MNNKIIGFTISERSIDHSDIDVFKVGLKMVHKKVCGMHLYYWGVGNISKCYIKKNVISLSFPMHSSLEDRNVLITVDNCSIKIENDWLGSIPIYYDLKSKIVSTLINKVVSNNFKIDSVGLPYYLRYGFSVFEHTPIKDLHFLRYYSKIVIKNNVMRVKYKVDSFIDRVRGVSKSNETIREIDNYLKNGEGRTVGDVYIPTSGGYDSRLLNMLFCNKKRIRSFTYGITYQSLLPQREVEYAREVTGRLGISWREIKLKYFHKHCDEWFRLFGCSTHLHGMYHIEFYARSLARVSKKRTLLSGIVGDLWSGGLEIRKITSSKDLRQLAYTHEIHIDEKYSKFDFEEKLSSNYYKKYKKSIDNARTYPIHTVRLKMILLSYLMSIPDYFGMPSWTPFLNFNIVKKMLTLPESERENRVWQKNIFKKNKLDVEKKIVSQTNLNTLNKDAFIFYPLKQINEVFLPFIKSNKIRELKREHKKMLSTALRAKFLLKRFEKSKRLSVFILKHATKNFDISVYNKIIILKSMEHAVRKYGLMDNN